ncbi:hypothetical protein THAOC_16724, partial [Thalassiosira oceanica]
NCEGHFVPHTRAEFLRACCGATAWQNDGGLRLRFHGTDFLDVGPEAKRTTVSFHLVRRGRDGEQVCKSGDAYRAWGPWCGTNQTMTAGSRWCSFRGWVDGRGPRRRRWRAAGGDDGTGKKGGGREDPTKKPPSKRARTGGVEQKGKRSGRGRKGGASNRQSPKRGLLRRAKAARTKAVIGKSESERASTADEYPDFAISGSDWNCQHCTLINPGAQSVCNGCERRRGSTRGRNGRRSAPPAICVGVERSGDVKSHEALVTSSKRRKKHRKKKKKKKKNAHDRDEDESTEKRCLGVVHQGSTKKNEGSLNDDVRAANYSDRPPKKLVATELNSTASEDCDTPNKAGEQKLAPSDSVHLSELNAGVMAEERAGEGQTREEEDDADGHKPTTSKPAGVTPQGQPDPSSHRASSHKIQIKGPGRYVFTGVKGNVTEWVPYV